MAITYHNEGPLLTECLESLWSGPVQPDEILIYDDASDGAASGFVPDHLQARVIRGEENVGPSAARNRLLAEAASEYIHFHDSDDLFLPLWCSRNLASLTGTGPDAVFCECSFFDCGRCTSERVIGLSELSNGRDLTSFCIDHCILVPGGVYRTARLREIGGYNDHVVMSEDYELHLRLAAAGISYGVIDEPLVHVRWRTQSRSRDAVGRWYWVVRSIEMLHESIGENHREQLAAAVTNAAGYLYMLGRPDLAEWAFGIADQLGGVRYAGSSRLRRSLYRSVGPMHTEGLAALYRRLVPGRVRLAVRRDA